MPIARNGLSWFSRNLIEFLPPLFMSAASMRLLLRSNGRQPMLWGRTSDLGQIAEKFCASRKLFRPDGTYLPHAETPMGWVLRTGLAARDRKIVIERPDGSRVTVLVNIAPLFDKHGLQIGAVNCFQDLRAQKLSEKKRERLHDELHQSKKMEAVGQLTGGLAHAINNLRAGITASPDLLQIRIRQGRVNDLERFT